MADLTERTVKTPVGETPLIPLVLAAIGFYVLWVSIRYFKRIGPVDANHPDNVIRWPSDPVKALLSGKALPSAKGTPESAQAILSGDIAGAQQAYAQAQLTASGGVTPGTGEANPNAFGQAVASGAGLGPSIAADAQRYIGAGYVFGGNASKIGDWDCSSFVSYVLGHDLGLSLPGGGKWGDPGYPPNSHGPATTNYMLFGQGIPLSEVRAGDLVVSTVHMGIATGPTTMVSAQDPQQGTGPGEFPTGFPGGPPVYRRIT